MKRMGALFTAIRDWTVGQISGSADDFNQLICEGKWLRGLVELTPARWWFRRWPLACHWLTRIGRTVGLLLSAERGQQ